ncbi:hypothetical protein IE53DRAFT_389386 [Violaceomyces palustris]|uniref:Uncharacterized protein n=1 Tax=Violaceomyces palustris TaxID=1673888 RepID=A0ACD0NRQ6_9BASI|nr:hypothetical protein IE53DRAFT_389386 [Violaceomyces palustris]
MPLFVLSPASLAHSALFAGYYTYLSSNVISYRLKTGLTLGDGGPGSVVVPSHKPSPEDATNQEKLKKSIRAHANFAESTPFAFFLIFLAELNGAPTSLVHGAFATLFLSRVAHSEFGIRLDSASGFGRPIGALATMAVTVAAGLYNLNLGYEPLKSFLGFK